MRDRKIGRPSLGMGSTRGPRLSIRLTPDAMERVQQRATQSGLSPSDWVRQAIDEKLERAK